MKTRKAFLPAIGIILIISIVIALMYARKATKPSEKITIAVSVVPLSAPVYVGLF